MELLKTFFSKDTKRGRVVRTLIQAFIGILGFVYGFLAIPGVQDYLVHNNVVSITTLAASIAIASYVYNALEQAFKFLFSDGSN